MEPSAATKLDAPSVAPQDRGFVFISYKREEAAHAEMLKRLIESHGFTVWWDLHIQCGQVWSQVLDDAVRDAGCIVVLWSRLAMESPWVTHEASRAMDRGIYAPARIELCRIGAPYDRLQATDIIDWNGDPNHPGVLRLLSRIDSLLPQPLSVVARLRRWLWQRIAAVSAVFFALLALSILMWQTLAGRRQLSQMANLVEQQRAVAADLQAMRKGQDVLLPRIVTKFGRITASMSVRLPVDHPAVREYIEKAIQGVPQNSTGSFEPWPPPTGTAGEIEKTMAQFIAARALPDAIIIKNASGNDLTMELRQATGPYRSLDKDPRSLEVRYMNLQVASRGSLRSLSDVAGAKLTIEYLPVETVAPEEAPPGDEADRRQRDALFNEIQTRLEISVLELTFDGQTYTFENFTKEKSSESGKVLFSMTIPETFTKPEAD